MAGIIVYSLAMTKFTQAFTGVWHAHRNASEQAEMGFWWM